MLQYVTTRLISLIPTLLGASILVFALIRLVPGTVVELSVSTYERTTEEVMESLRAFYGLDQPSYVQYAKWISKVLRGDLGNSWRTGQPVLELILSRLPVTVELTVGAMFVALLLGIPFGVVSAIRENTILDHFIRVISLFSLCVPLFWQATMIILVLSLWFKWTPPIGYVDPITDAGTNIAQTFLPVIVLGTAVSASIMRMTRSCLLDVMREDYICTARSKGVQERMVVGTHALKNALIPVVTVSALQVGYLLGGVVVTEEVFSLPGLGRLVLWSIQQRDYPVVQGALLLIAVMFAMANLVADVIYGYVDPRIHYAE